MNFNTFWKPVKSNLKPAKQHNLKPTKNGWNVPNSKLPKMLNLNIYPKRSTKENRLIDKMPFEDADKDGVLNYFDCKPLNKKRQGWAHESEKFNKTHFKHKIVMMAPSRFLKATYRERALKPNIYSLGKEFDDSKNINKKDYDKYRKELLKNKSTIKEKRETIIDKEWKEDIPFLIQNEKGFAVGHQGRHRAIAAEQEGIKRIPVLVTKRRWDKENEKKEYGTISTKSADIPIKEQREYGIEQPQTIKKLLEEWPIKISEEPIINWKTSEEFHNQTFDLTKRTMNLPPEKVLTILKSQQEDTIDLPLNKFEEKLKKGYPLKKLKEDMMRGSVIPRPSISFHEKYDETKPDEWSGAHGEGRHRALAAKELGAKEIPVDIMEDRPVIKNKIPINERKAAKKALIVGTAMQYDPMANAKATRELIDYVEKNPINPYQLVPVKKNSTSPYELIPVETPKKSLLGPEFARLMGKEMSDVIINSEAKEIYAKNVYGKDYYDLTKEEKAKTNRYLNEVTKKMPREEIKREAEEFKKTDEYKKMFEEEERKKEERRKVGERLKMDIEEMGPKLKESLKSRPSKSLSDIEAIQQSIKAEETMRSKQEKEMKKIEKKYAKEKTEGTPMKVIKVPLVTSLEELEKMQPKATIQYDKPIGPEKPK